jgi:hypothetical protein
MKFKVVDRKGDKLLCEGEWTDEIPMPIRGDSFTFDGGPLRGPLLRIVECLYVMEGGETSQSAQIARVTFLVEEDVPARSQHLR